MWHVSNKINNSVILDELASLSFKIMLENIARNHLLQHLVNVFFFGYKYTACNRIIAEIQTFQK